MRNRVFCAELSLGMQADAASSRAKQPPPIPVGTDAYLEWGQWADQRIGMRAYMRSTYDRHGGNAGADASHFLYQLSDDFQRGVGH